MKAEGGPDSTLDELDLLLEDDAAGDDEEEALRKCVVLFPFFFTPAPLE